MFSRQEIRLPKLIMFILLLFSKCMAAASAAGESQPLPERTTSGEQKVPLIIIPGIMGTSLVTNDAKHEVIWPTILGRNLLKLRLDPQGNDMPDQVLIPSRVIRKFKLLSIYEHIFKFFSKRGYIEGQTLFEFPYDWRKDLSIAARNLGEYVQRARAHSDKVIIVAHSTGGLVAREYLADGNNAQEIEKLFMLGTPHHAAPKAYGVLTQGVNPLPPITSLTIKRKEIMGATSNMQGLYTLLPSLRYEQLNGGGFSRTQAL